jgi:hypothetical protein
LKWKLRVFSIIYSSVKIIFLFLISYFTVESQLFNRNAFKSYRMFFAYRRGLKSESVFISLTTTAAWYCPNDIFLAENDYSLL